MKESIKIIPFPDSPNAFVVISAHESRLPNKVKQNLSYIVDLGNDTAVEWEPEYGPLTLLTKCGPDHPDARPHWYFPFYIGQGQWSQLAVLELELNELLTHGEYEVMFQTMANWGGCE